MKNLLKYIPWIIIAILVFILLLPKACDSDEKTTIKTTVKQVPYKIKEVEGGFQKPSNTTELPISEPDTVFIGGQPIYIPSPLDSELIKELEATKSERDRYKVLANAARKREYSNDYNDSNVDINVKSTVYGTLEDTQVKYTIKEKTILVPETTIEKETVKRQKFSMYAGGGINQTENKSINYEGVIGIRFNKLVILGTATTDSQVGAKILLEF